MRITMIALCLPLFSALVWAGTWRDDFEDGDFEGWTTFGAADSFSVDNGEMVLRTPLFFPNGISIEIGDDTWVEESIKCDVRIIKPLNASYVFHIYFRWIGDRFGTKGYVSFGNVNNFRRIVVAGWNGANVNVRTQAIPVALDQWYHLKVVIKNKTVWVYVNGDVIFNAYTNPILPDNGRVGFGTMGAEIHVDNILISGPGVPDGGPGAQAVSPTGKLATTWGKLKAF